MTAPDIGSLLPRDLPDGRALAAEGRALGAGVRMGRSLLCEQHGVRSEVEYKRKMTAEGRIMTSMNIGMKTWADTARALERIHEMCERRGFRIDRFQMQVDRRMGLPQQYWTRAAKETGPMLESPEDWHAVTRTVPIQPHLGDFMIGSPASVDNACRALEAGVTYVGNMSQFNWKYPVWPGDDVEQMAEMVKALGVMAAKADEDATVHSYLDDGYAAQFKDFCSYVGWALFERYVVEALIGANLSIAYGGLTHDPVAKAAMILALEGVKPEGRCNAFYQSNTTAYSTTPDANFAVLSVDVLYMMLAVRRTASTCAVVPVPVTEAIRIPSWEEIVQVQTVARRVANDADALMESLNWPHIEGLSERLTAGGRRFFENLLEGLGGLGVDTSDPLALLVSVRRLGAPALENRFGVGELPNSDTELYGPLVPADTFSDFLERRDVVRERIRGAPVPLRKGVRLIVGSTDIHEYALFLLIDAMKALGIEPVVAGTSVDPDEFADLALEAGADAILVSTHNGMALSYARQLHTELAARGLSLAIAMGGTLNQDVEDAPDPVDVSEELVALGVKVCRDVTDVLDIVRDAA